jgi:hypothetical protein
VGLVFRGAVAQAVVDVERLGRAGEARGEVEQADRVAAAGEQDEDGAFEQAAGADFLLGRGHAFWLAT